MSDIKTINVDGISYNINLPDNSTVNGLTVTGTLTASNITTSKIDTTSFKLSSRVTSYDLTIQEDQGYVPTVYGAYLNCLLENNLHISAPQIDISSQSINCVSTVATFSGVTASVINGTLLVGDNLSCNNINNFTP